MKKTGFHRYVSDAIVVNDVLDIYKYLMKKHDKMMF